MRLSCRAVSVALLVCHLASTRALAQQYRFDHFTTSNGLPQNTVSAIAQTRDGYLWFGTYDGLVRYDGVRFSIFDKGNTPAFGSNQILTLAEAADGSLWVGTVEGGMIRYRHGVFTAFTTRDGLPANYVAKIVDTPKGLLLPMGAAGWTPWTRDNQATPAAPSLLSEYTGRSGVRWTIARGSLVRTADRQASFPVDLTPDDFVRSRFEEQGGALWMGMRSRGLYRADANGLRQYTEADGLPADAPIRVGGQDRDGNVWLSTDKVVLRFRDGRFVSYGAADGIDTQLVRTLFCDREGIVWVGTNENGLFPDLAARYGGEEFAVVLTDTNTEGALVVAQVIRGRVSGMQIPHRDSTVGGHVTVTIGVATATPASGGDPDALVALADQLLYRAKELGRDRCLAEAELSPS